MRKGASGNSGSGGGSINRRGFLQGLATAGGAAAASALVAQPANAIDVVQQRTTAGHDRGGAAAKSGYRVTPHILEYYEKARF